MKSIVSGFRSLWYHGDKVLCNCCSHRFRSFRFVSAADTNCQFVCPSCGSTAEERMIRFFLQNDTSFYGLGSKNVALSANAHLFLEPFSDVILPQHADFYLCREIDPSVESTFFDLYQQCRPGACFVFVCQFPSQKDMEDHLLVLFRKLGITGYSKINFQLSVRKSDRITYGLTSDVPIYILVKPWALV